jgi:rod shape-determining protein MreC
VLQLLKRYRELIVVAVLLLFPLGVFFARAKRPAERSAVDRAVVWVTTPVERAVSWVVTGVGNVWHGYVALRGARAQADALQREVDLLHVENEQLRSERAETERLRQLVGMAQAGPTRTYLGARVIGVELSPSGLQLLRIDRGEADGVQKGNPVVVAEGVVGRVHTALAHSAEVLTLVDRNSSIAVRVDRTRARGNVRGMGRPGACKLDYALRTEDMIEGDALVTSGTDGVFPRGLPVGKVTQLKKNGNGLFQDAAVLPAVDVTHVEEVLVITRSELPTDAAALGAERSP